MTEQATTHNIVMLIDDSEVDNLMHERLIKKMGLAKQVLIHTSARSGIEYLQSIQQLRPALHTVLPSLVFLDINMPIMDGHLFLEAFDKLHTDIKARVHIFILTSLPQEASGNLYKKYTYVRGYLTKPLTAHDLSKVVAKIPQK